MKMISAASAPDAPAGWRADVSDTGTWPKRTVRALRRL